MTMIERIKIIILLLILSLISFVVILINGSTYELRIKINDNIKNISDIEITTGDKNVIKIVDKKLKDKVLVLRLKSVNKGHEFIEVLSNKHFSIDRFYVHGLGIMTHNRILGKCSGDIVVPISILILILAVLYIELKHYIKSVRNNLYQYKNITYLALIIFLTFMFVNQLIQITNYKGLAYSIELIIKSVNEFSKTILPLVIITSLLVTISHIKLLKREGFTWRNMLGVILGLLLIILTLTPNILSKIFENSQVLIDDKTTIAYYIYTFIELFIYALVSYLECIFISTIFLALISAKRIPKFNKDYIIILGCRIRKDGTLTPILKSRVDRAINFSKMQYDATGKDIIFIPSGGKGSDEVISEGEAIKNYLLEQGINKNSIIVENKSKNTYENIKFSYRLINKKNKGANIAFSTTNFHVFRAGLIATEQGIKIEGIGARTKAYFSINAFIREFIATLYSEKRSIYRVIILIIITVLIIITLTYISMI